MFPRPLLALPTFPPPTLAKLRLGVVGTAAAADAAACNGWVNGVSADATADAPA
ncbi:hypothetical protein MSIMFB_03863 [Mycobacterium simulans]|uniref:Uncharacterized protein n=1 Tax=Mycobacterium simulans TaxID=627089 RepID=A0A7Z7IMK4_9MYCO|nr:hypothetical protein MSIMFB_03863 [Mycobacterium simulans]